MGQQARTPARRPAERREDHGRLPVLVACVARRVRVRAVGRAVGNPQLPALRGAHDQHEQHGALLGALRVASIAVGRAAGPQLHAGHPVREALQGRHHGLRVQRVQPADRVQHPAELQRRGLRAAGHVLLPAAARAPAEIHISSIRRSTRSAAFARVYEQRHDSRLCGLCVDVLVCFIGDAASVPRHRTASRAR